MREAVRDRVPRHVLDREKHPLLAPLVTTSPAARTLVADTLASVPPFFDRDLVTGLVDRLPSASPSERVRVEPVVMMLPSASILGSHYGLSA